MALFWVLRRDILAVQQNLTVGNRVGTSDRSHEIGAPGTDQAGHAEDLAFLDLKTDVGEGAFGRCEILDFHDRFIVGRRDIREHAVHAAADHRFDDGSDRYVRGFELLHLGAVAQDHDPVGDLFDLFQAVRDVDDPDTF